MKILGNIITGGCIKLDPDRIKEIENYPKPKTIKELRGFLGTINSVGNSL